MKLGLYGGSFDPIHNAHLIIAQFVLDELQLEKVIFIPSAIPPHKETFASSEYRCKMVQLAIQDNPRFECSDVEIQRGGTSYSVDTITYFRDRYHLDKENLFWIMGSDNLVDLPNWKQPERILQMCTIVVFPRRKNNFHQAPMEIRQQVIYLKDAPIIDISSTTIRHFLNARRSIKYLVPPEVEKIILDKGLYHNLPK